MQPKSKTDGYQSQFLRSRVFTQPVLAQENSSLQRFNSSRVTFSREEDRENSSTLIFDAWLYSNGSEQKRLSVGRVDMKDDTAGLSTEFLDGSRTLSLSRKFVLYVTGGTDE